MGSALPQTLTSAINEARFLGHLRELFSTKSVVLAELMQNARRAGAPAVMFHYQANGDLCVTDEGCGIDDFQALLTLAESGWSQPIMESEQPFGIGFASVSFSAEQVCVESRARKIRFSADDLVAKRPIPVEACNYAGAMRITLAGFKLDQSTVDRELRRYAYGFAIDVYWNDECLPRPHAQHALTGAVTDIGFVHVPGIHRGSGRDSARVRVYCQGLPVQVESFTSGRYIDVERAIVVHVDHRRYKPRVPDRDCLIDAAAAARDFSAAIKALWRAHLLARKVQLAADQFAETYWDISQRMGCFEIMCDVPYLPRQALSFVEDYPVVPYEYESFMSMNERGLTQEAVMRRVVGLFQPEICEREGDGFARMLYAQAKGGLFVDALPAGHWAQPYVVDLWQARLRIACKAVAMQTFEGRYVSGLVKVVDSLSIVLDGDAVAITQPVALGSDYNTVFLVPKDSPDPAEVLRQAASYRDDSDTYQETDHDLDRDEFANLVSVLCGEDPCVTLHKCLTGGSSRSRTNLRGRRFLVSIDANGEASTLLQD